MIFKFSTTSRLGDSLNNNRLLITVLIILLSLNSNDGTAQTNMTEDDSFIIFDNRQDRYTGVVKDNKPYDGYFKRELLDEELFVVDYYEQGVIKYQYSLDLLEYLLSIDEIDYDEDNKLLLNIKSTYKSNRIDDGEEFIAIDKGVITKKLSKGKLTGFTVDMFAVHYYNRIIAKKDKHNIYLENFIEKGSIIKLSILNNRLSSTLSYHNKTLIHRGKYDFDINKLPPNTKITCIKNEQELNYSLTSDELMEVYNDIEMTMDLYRKSYHLDIEDIDLLLLYLLGTFTEEPQEEFNKNGEKERPLIVSYLFTDSESIISHGIHWLGGEKKEGDYQIYSNKEIIESKETSFIEYQSLARKYIDSLPRD